MGLFQVIYRYTEFVNLVLKESNDFLTNLTKEFDRHATYFYTEKTVIALIRSNF